MTTIDEVPDATTVAAVLADYEQQGFVTSFAAAEGGRIRCFGCKTASDAKAFRVTALARTEGASDPADAATVIAALCPWCSASGTLVLGFGPSASQEDADVLRLIEDARPVGEAAVLLSEVPED